MTQRAHNNEHMHDLMTAADDIKSPGKPAFWYPHCIDRCACEVQDAETEEVGEGHAGLHLRIFVNQTSMDDGEECAEAEDCVKIEADAAVCWRAKCGFEGKDDAQNCKCRA